MKLINNDILNELEQLSPLLANMERVNIFAVPHGYFENLSNDLLVAAKRNNAIPKEILETVPKKYFENLADNILNKIRIIETSNIDDKDEPSPIFHDIKNKNVFNVPDKYFVSLAQDILAKVKSHETKTVPTSNIFLRYAAAAVVAGIILLTSIIQFNSSTNYIASHATIQNTVVAKLDASIEEGINMNDKQFDETLNNLSIEDIASYLETHTSEADMAMLTSNIDEGILPTEDDYFLDEETLENYLQEIGTTSLTN